MNSLKSLLCVFSILIGVSAARADADDYLVISVEKFAYSQADSSKNTHDKEGFKVFLDSNFLNQFKNPPTPNSAGTQFYCGVSDSTGSNSTGIVYTQWFAPQAAGKVATWFWAEGSETVHNQVISAHNAIATTTLNFSSWSAVDSREMLSFVNNYDGINISVGVKFVSATDPMLARALLAPVKNADGSAWVAGDAQAQLPFRMSCAFQNN